MPVVQRRVEPSKVRILAVHPCSPLLFGGVDRMEVAGERIRERHSFARDRSFAGDRRLERDLAFDRDFRDFQFVGRRRRAFAGAFEVIGRDFHVEQVQAVGGHFEAKAARAPRNVAGVTAGGRGGGALRGLGVAGGVEPLVVGRALAGGAAFEGDVLAVGPRRALDFFAVERVEVPVERELDRDRVSFEDRAFLRLRALERSSGGGELGRDFKHFEMVEHRRRAFAGAYSRSSVAT